MNLPSFLLYRQRARRRPTAREPPGQRMAQVPELQRSPRAPEIFRSDFATFFHTYPLVLVVVDNQTTFESFR